MFLKMRHTEVFPFLFRVLYALINFNSDGQSLVLKLRTVINAGDLDAGKNPSNIPRELESLNSTMMFHQRFCRAATLIEIHLLKQSDCLNKLHRHPVNDLIFVSLLVKKSWKDHTQEAVCIYTPGCNSRNMPSILRDAGEGMDR